MISKRKTAQIAKFMYKASLTDNHLDEPKILKILSQITKTKIQGLSKILKAYKYLVHLQSARERVVIESSTKLDPKMEKIIISKTQARKLQYQLKAQTIGAKIMHGDWEFDATLDAKLDQIAKSTM